MRPQVPPSFYPNYRNEPSFTSLQIRQEKEAELRANDQHWQKRINQLEETHEKINQLMEQEYNCAVCKLKSYRIILYLHLKCYNSLL